jgi:hypothetical protein
VVVPGASVTTTAPEENLNLPRLLVVAPMKSGSSYVGRVLRSYFGIEEALRFPHQIDFNAEHNLTPWMIATLRNRGFCFNFHMLPHVSNMEVVAEERIALLGLWRNIGDMVVSWDDHVVGDNQGGVNFFVLDQERFKALPSSARFTFIIDTIVPWYLNFYLRWHKANLTLNPYEQMLLDRKEFFREMLAPLLIHPPLEKQLDGALGGGPRSGDRFNVGRQGRSAEKIDDANKRLLESKILRHPDADQLEVLLWELPWDVPALEPRGPLDGRVVRAATDETAFFVSRGRAYPIARGTWLRGRTGERRTAQIADDALLAALPRGAALV